MRKRTLLRISVLGAAAALLLCSAAEAAGPFQFFSVTPCRIVDTRNANGITGGPRMAGLTTRNFPIAGQCGLPLDAKAATLNVTVVSPSASGHLTIWPYGQGQPFVSTMNYGAGEPALANGAIVPLSSDPQFSVSVFAGIPATAGVDVVLDVTGYFK